MAEAGASERAGGLEVAIVTGASRGIGAAVARQLASELGRAVVVNYASEGSRGKAEAVCAAVEAAGSRAVAVRADVGTEAGVDALFAAAAAWIAAELPPGSRLSGLVNNAGILGPRTNEIRAVDGADLDGIFAVNVGGAVRCAKAAEAVMAARNGGGGGSIVNISSGSAYLGTPLLYGMTKAALNALQAGLVDSLAREGIRMNTVSPGTTKTDMTADVVGREALIPMGRYGEPDEIAAAVVWLMDDQKASYVHGANIRVSGGRQPGTVIG